MANRITADDLFAVQLLEVAVPAEVGLDLLEGELGEAAAARLQRIPTEVSIDQPQAAELLSDGGPADQLWHLLKQPDGMGWVTVGKLLARKRPRLIPVYDRVVRCAYGNPSRFWTWLQPMFVEQDGALTRQLEVQRANAEVPALVSALRVLDVIVWMSHHRTHRAARCQGLAWSELCARMTPTRDDGVSAATARWPRRRRLAPRLRPCEYAEHLLHAGPG